MTHTACRADVDHLATSSNADAQERSNLEIADRNVGYNVGQELPWVVDESCFPGRNVSPYQWLSIYFGGATADNLGTGYEIELHDDRPFRLANGELPDASSETLHITARYDRSRNAIYYEVFDVDHEFLNALFKATEITLRWGSEEAKFSMADSSRMREKVAACNRKRYPLLKL
jgi:hypothetical protein